MIEAATPENEAERLAALRRYKILDTPAEAEFEEFAQLAAQICGVPIALITLVDADRQWFKSHLGMEAGETPRAVSFCAHAIQGRTVLEVENALEDDRFFDNPLVTGEPNIRFYAGAPLTTLEGNALGTLCVIDRVPRRLTADQSKALAMLSRQVVARLELRRNEEQLRLLETCISRLNDIILITEAEPLHGTGPRIVFVNDAFERRTGYTREEALGKTPRILQGPKTDRAELDRIASALDKWQPVRAELINYTKNGEEFWLELDIVPIADRTGWFTNWVAVERDISERKRWEILERDRVGQLFESQERNRLLIEGSRDAMVTLHPPTWNFTSCNPAARSMFGAETEAEFFRFTPGNLSPERQPNGQPSADLAFEMIEIAMREGSHLFEWMHQRLDGTVFPVMVLLSRLEQGGQPFLQSTLRDITVQKQAESALLRVNAELERTARLKDEFLANMSHELRTPLNAILGLSEALLEQIGGPLTPRQIKSLTTISTSGSHLLALINDILDLSKIEAGKLELHLERVDLEDFCQNCLAFVRSHAMQKSIGIAFEDDGRRANFVADPKRLKQILVNLLSNAVKFTPDGGRIGLSVTAPEGEEVMRFTVWDTGIGIGPQDQQRLFRPFVQVDSGLNRAQEGTGLGLALVGKLVDLHSGSVTLESEPGRGSRFHVTLPLSTQMGGEYPAAAAASPTVLQRALVTEDGPPATALLVRSARRASILLAEDNEANIQTFGSYLEAKGYSLHYARNGSEAVKLAGELHPPLILMDIQMPVMDGLTAIRKIREDSAQKDTIIIALTALAMPGDRERCLAAGANEYLSKPVSLKVLTEIIANLLSAAGEREGE